MSRKLKAVLASVAILGGLLGTATIAQAVSGSSPLASDPPPPGAAAVVSCRGGAQEAVQVVTNTAPVFRGVGGPLPIPAMTLAQPVPAGDSDLFVVTFSSESKLIGAAGPDRLDVRVVLDGVPMAPFGPNTFVEGTNNAVQNSGTWCARATGGNHIVSAQWSLVDAFPNGGLTAQMDDTALHLEVSN